MSSKISRKTLAALVVKESVYILVAKNTQAFETNIDNGGELKYKHIDDVIFLSAMLHVPYMREGFAAYFNKHANDLYFTESLLEYRHDLLASVTEKPPGGQNANCWYRYVLGLYHKVAILNELQKNLFEQFIGGKIDAAEMAEIFFKNSKNNVVIEFKEANASSLTVSELLGIQSKMQQYLANKVKGQLLAIREFSNGYVDSRIEKTEGPKGIFTLMGVPGSGKTMLAKEAVNIISQLEGQEYKLLTFNMEQYTNKMDVSSLFGTGSFYTEAALGGLTDFIRNYPKTIIVLDEIEKAHTTVIQSLLTPLDSGVAKDATSNLEVDFSQCYFILTTNIGSDLIEQRNTLDHKFGSIDETTIIDILRSSTSASGQSLSPELVSRIAKGKMLLFNRLKPEHLIDIFEKGSKELLDRNRDSGLSPKLLFNREAAILYVLSLLPSLDARLVNAHVKKVYSELSRHIVIAMESHGGGDLKRFSSYFEDSDFSTTGEVDKTNFIEINGKKALDKVFDRKKLQKPISILVVDDDEEVFTLLKRSLDETRLELCSFSDGCLSRVPDHIPDLILLDISLNSDDDSGNVLDGFNALQALTDRFAQIPVYVYSKNPQNRLRFENTMMRAVQHGGAEGYVPFYSGNGPDMPPENLDSAISESLRQDFTESGFIKNIQEKRDAIYIGKLIEKLVRENVRLDFQIQFDINMTNQVSVNFPALRFETVTQSVDMGDSIGNARIPDERFHDVIGLTRAKNQLSKAVEWLNNPAALARYNLSPPSGYILQGPPGTGKTLLARAMAGECAIPFFSVSATDLVASVVGGSSERINALYKKARKYAPSIVFIDEIDAIGGKRVSATNGADKERNTVVNTLLTNLDGFTGKSRPVLTLAATNFPELLDPALVRPGRFDEAIFCDLPTRADREKLFHHYLNKNNIQMPDEAIMALSKRAQFASPAEISQIVKQTAYNCIAKSKEVDTDALMDAARDVIYGAVNETDAMIQREKKLVAYHEAGHALVRKRLYPESYIDYITIQPSGNALGFVSYRDEENKKLYTASDARKQIQILLAGRLAQSKFAGEDYLDSGASDDLKRATEIAYKAVSQYGFDAEVGGLSIEGGMFKSDQSLNSLVSKRIKHWLDEAESECKQILEENRNVLDALAELLAEEEALDATDLKNFFKP